MGFSAANVTQPTTGGAMSRFMDPSQTGGATNVVRQPGFPPAMSQPATGGKGGGSAASPAPQTGVGTPAGGFNVNQAAASGLQSAMQGTGAAMNYQPMQVGAAGYNAATMAGVAPIRAQNVNAAGYNAATMAGAAPIRAQNVSAADYSAATMAGAAPIRAQNVQAGQIAGTNLGAYTNPYESQVVGQALGDIERLRQMQQNQLGAQATAARAFGGSRQGIAEAETNRAFAQQAANTAAQLRQAGYGQAQQLAGQDIATRMQASLANQQAGLTAQGQTAANVLAAQQANMAAQNQAGQFGASARNAAMLANQQAGLTAQGQTAANVLAAQQANMAARNQAGQFGAAAQNAAMMANQQAGLTAQQSSAANALAAQQANMAARNQAGQFGASAQNAAMLANQQAGLQGAQQRLGAAAQMGQLGQQAFNTGQAITNQQLQQGTLQQALQQQLIDAARGQYAGFTNAPMGSLQAPLAALGATPNTSTTTSSQQPGLFNYLSLPFLM